jgi:L-iditol 2-dehydrogenase
MKAIYLDSVQKLSERDIPMPVPESRQVLVQIKAVGICGSDVHYWHNGRIGSFVVEKPMVLGHECSGIVIDAGSGAKGLKRGDRVVIEPGEPCRKCAYCMSGRYNLCRDIAFFATPPYDGCLLEYVVFDSNFVYKIPDEIEDFGLATLAEPMAVGVFSTSRLKPRLGDRAVVFGAGIIGIACMMAAKAVGCQEISVADIRGHRLEKAREMGADRVINLKSERLPDDYYDVGYDATGADQCYALAVKAVKPGGRLSLVGMGPDMQSAPLVEYVCREIDIVTSFRYANSFPQAIGLVKENKDRLREFITHRLPFSLENVEKALLTAFSDQSAGKVVVDFA